ncbi:MAG: class I SAM-dependent methyltransferase [Betaproteobacteria bacterium]
MNTHPVLHWNEAGAACSARWRSERGTPPHKKVVIADDRMTADAAYHHACEGTALLWRGDFNNARQLLHALTTRADRKPRAARVSRGGPAVVTPPTPFPQAFHLYRQARAQRARVLGMLLIPLDADYGVPLSRAPDVRLACGEAYGTADAETPASVTSLRELLGLIGAHEWRKKGMDIPTLAGRIHPHYGVFAPVRNDYIELVIAAPLPSPAPALAFDIGAGTGVIAAVLAQRGIVQTIATEQDPRALACARENIARLGFFGKVKIVETDLFPEGRAQLIVCNPPWLPGRPGSPLEHAIYDPDSRMLLGFIAGLAAHLEADGEGWLVLSDLAERLGLRTREALLAAFEAGGLTVSGRSEVRPHHPRTQDRGDALHAMRAGEVTSLWRLKAH